MQVHDIGQWFACSYPFGGRGAEERECVRIARKRSTLLILMINTAATVLCKQGVIEDDVPGVAVVSRHIPDVNFFRAAAKVDIDCA